MGRKICCFAGHSKLYKTEEIYDELIKLIEKLITEEKVSEFLVGNYGSFDSLSAVAVKKLKLKFPYIKLTLIVPYVTTDINKNKEFYSKEFDNILLPDFPEKTPRKIKILKCNEYMVDESDFMICYVKYDWGGASKTLAYANKKHIKIYNLEVV